MQGKDSELFSEIKKVVRLLSLIAVGDRKQIDQIERLSKAGFQPKEIAELLGTTANTVSVALTKIKKIK
jgi:hypothetical protein